MDINIPQKAISFCYVDFHLEGIGKDGGGRGEGRAGMGSTTPNYGA